MASSGCRTRPRLVLALAVLLLGTGCSRQSRVPAPAPAKLSVAEAVGELPAADPGLELPPGPGRDILLTDCLGCHDLGGIELFAGFYTRADWQLLVETMVAHGATVDAAGVELLADYLARHFGPRDEP